LHLATELLGRRVDRHELEQATHAVGTVEGSLRSPQDLDPGEIVGIDIRYDEPSAEIRRGSVRHVVDGDPYGGIRSATRRDASDRYELISLRTGGGHGQPGYAGVKVLQTSLIALEEGVGADCRDWHGNVLKSLLALLRGDHDFRQINCVSSPAPLRVAVRGHVLGVTRSMLGELAGLVRGASSVDPDVRDGQRALILARHVNCNRVRVDVIERQSGAVQYLRQCFVRSV